MALSGQAIGGQILVYIDGVAIAHSTDATFNISKDMIPAVSKDTTNQMREKSPGAGEWSVDVSGLVVYNASYGIIDITALINTGTAVNVKFSPNSSGNTYYHGSAYFTSVSISAPDQDNVTFTCSLEGDGDYSISELT